jgi:hypothetical protein
MSSPDQNEEQIFKKCLDGIGLSFIGHGYTTDIKLQALFQKQIMISISNNLTFDEFRDYFIELIEYNRESYNKNIDNYKIFIKNIEGDKNDKSDTE